MNMKHTPGPWTADGFTVEADCNGIVVAEVRGPDHRARGKERMEDFEYCRGNARLIAAAPELLDALCTVILEHDAGGVTLATMSEAREVIAKATEAA